MECIGRTSGGWRPPRIDWAREVGWWFQHPTRFGGGTAGALAVANETWPFLSSRATSGPGQAVERGSPPRLPREHVGGLSFLRVGGCGSGLD